jgi:hypothetical protein
MAIGRGDHPLAIAQADNDDNESRKWRTMMLPSDYRKDDQPV